MRHESEAKTKHDYVAYSLLQQYVCSTCALEFGANKQLRQKRSEITDTEKDQQGKRSACREQDGRIGDLKSTTHAKL